MIVRLHVYIYKLCILVYFLFSLADVTVGMEETFYTVFENEGRIKVCVVVEPDDCSSSHVFIVELNTRDDSAGISVNEIFFLL